MISTDRCRKAPASTRPPRATACAARPRAAISSRRAGAKISTVVSRALATRILFEGRRAVGVEYRRRRRHALRARRCRGDRRVGHIQLAATAAAFGARAGVAAAASLGIPVVADAAGRRRGAQRPLCRPHHPALQGADHAQRRAAQLCAEGSRPGCATASPAAAISRSRRSRRVVSCARIPASETPDSQCSIALYSGDAIGGKLHPFPGVTGVCTLLRPGEPRPVRIKSADPRQPPAIHPNYLATQKDRETIVAGVKALRRIFQAPAMARHIAEEIEPGKLPGR